MNVMSHSAISNNLLQACGPRFSCLIGRPLSLNGLLSNMSSSVMRGVVVGTIVLGFVGFVVVAILQSNLRHSFSRILLKKPLPPKLPLRKAWYSRNTSIPLKDAAQAYHKWSKILGPLIHLQIHSRDVLVLNTPSLAQTLLEKRSKIYCCRPIWTMADMIGRQDNVGFTYYGEKLKKCRKLLHRSLSAGAGAGVRWWGKLLEDENGKFMEELSRTKDEGLGLVSLMKRHVASTIVRFTYGIEVTDEYISLAEEINREAGMSLIPGKWIVDSFPILKYFPEWLPGMGFKIWAREARTKFFNFTRGRFNETLRDTMTGESELCFVSDAIRWTAHNDDQTKITEEDASVLTSTAGSIYSAATDTTTAFLSSFLLLMTLYPSIQEKTYLSIKSFIRTHDNRLPILEDSQIQAIPYVEALIREVHRFRPVVTLVPHAPIVDDVWEGLRIPKKTWIMCNVWSMTHDEQLYPDPETFNPERHLDENGEMGNLKDPRNFTFGFGRRVCPGEYFANAHVFLFITRLLATYKLEGSPESTLSYTSAFISQPTPFKCTLKLRD